MSGLLSHEEELARREYEYVGEPTKLLMETIEIPLTEEQKEFMINFIHDSILEHGSRRPGKISEPKTLQDVKDGSHDFLWDRASGLVFFCLYGQHSQLAANLRTIRTVVPVDNLYEMIKPALKNRSSLSEDYMEDGGGFIFSSVNHRLNRLKITVGPDVRLTCQEQIILAAYDRDNMV